ncbi:hypothetical protein HPB49_021086 [Dermacentor silvarum]|uniref:Uncharacterized protein n=1 Tax=Dermacentor silvarum TaxID=543639 RepID=A0ACB8E3Y5_DERSI|nr:hypothetical protein HPB49_021086 [Dermacentor silvarum]
MKTQNESLTKENKSLKDENELSSKRLSALEQYSRLNNIEIKGVPATQGENCLAVVQAIGDRIGCPIVESDIDAVHRVPAEDTNIIARFCSRVKRSEFAAKARKARLTTSAIGFAQSSNKPIFINDHLTPDNKRLFAQALELKRGEHASRPGHVVRDSAPLVPAGPGPRRWLGAGARSSFAGSRGGSPAADSRAVGHMAHNGTGEQRQPPAHSAPAFRHSDVLLKLNLGAPRMPAPSLPKPAPAALFEGQVGDEATSRSTAYGGHKRGGDY